MSMPLLRSIALTEPFIRRFILIRIKLFKRPTTAVNDLSFFTWTHEIPPLDNSDASHSKCVKLIFTFMKLVINVARWSFISRY